MGRHEQQLMLKEKVMCRWLVNIVTFCLKGIFSNVDKCIFLK